MCVFYFFPAWVGRSWVCLVCLCPVNHGLQLTVICRNGYCVHMYVCAHLSVYVSKRYSSQTISWLYQDMEYIANANTVGFLFPPCLQKHLLGSFTLLLQCPSWTLDFYIVAGSILINALLKQPVVPESSLGLCYLLSCNVDAQSGPSVQSSSFETYVFSNLWYLECNFK